MLVCHQSTNSVLQKSPFVQQESPPLQVYTLRAMQQLVILSHT
ncbi:hypothetical protein BVRB_8g194070 [Beta vulgaris subsp. vulgaris]|nr:hypothetical protein BVRB_8g194070 [Beta vulgaris subsp. vulgaris]